MIDLTKILKTRTKEFFSLWKNYSFIYAFYNIIWWFCFYTRPPFCYKLSTYAIKKKTIWLDKYFEKKYNYIINKYKEEIVSSGKALTPPYIWFFWGQGEKNMPQIVKACYHQLTRNNGNVVFITNKNINEYINLPQIIIEKVSLGKISWANYSDIIRNTLLANYGGLWIDATVWVSGKVPFDKLNKLFLFSANSKISTTSRSTRFWTSFNYNWSTWCMWSKNTHNKLYSFVSEMLINIAIHENQWPDYVIQDYLIFYAYKNLDGIKELFEQNSTFSCKKRNELALIMNKEYNEEIYQEFIKSDYFFKLSFRANWKKKTEKGETTFYGKIIQSTR